MANPVLEELRLQIDKNQEVEASAVLLINGITARIQTAVDAALANGATAAELVPLTDELSQLNASATALADAVAAHTVAA